MWGIASEIMETELKQELCGSSLITSQFSRTFVGHSMPDSEFSIRNLWKIRNFMDLLLIRCVWSWRYDLSYAQKMNSWRGIYPQEALCHRFCRYLLCTTLKPGSSGSDLHEIRSLPCEKYLSSSWPATWHGDEKCSSFSFLYSRQPHRKVNRWATGQLPDALVPSSLDSSEYTLPSEENWSLTPYCHKYIWPSSSLAWTLSIAPN